MKTLTVSKKQVISYFEYLILNSFYSKLDIDLFLPTPIDNINCLFTDEFNDCNWVNFYVDESYDSNENNDHYDCQLFVDTCNEYLVSQLLDTITMDGIEYEINYID
jgi:hypothetical protein